MSKPREYSHPVLWSVLLLASIGGMAWAFYHWFEVGRRHGRDVGPVDFTPATAAAPVDHPALIADRSQAVLDRGQQLYLRNCASCHGPNGDQNASGSNPAPRNLQTEGYTAEWGGGPYGFWLTLTRGMGRGMPGFANLDAADRYAVVHFVRESWQQGKANYVEDEPAIAAQIPQPGAAADGPRTPPHLVPQSERLHPLMSVAATDGAARLAAAREWLGEAETQAEAAERQLLARVRAAGAARGGWLMALHEAARAGERARVAALLIAPASGDPSLALAPAASIEAAAQVLVAAAGRRA